jgi:DEAD/DEAH box helicase
MDVFSLRDTVVGECRKFATSFTTIHAEDIRQQVEAIYAEGRFWPEPLIQINPSYKKGAKVADLIGGGALDPRTADIFRSDGAPLSLYKHQEQAVALSAQGESYVVTTGTGSGKSACFFIPIVNAVLAEKRTRTAPRTRAIIIYPMNALANSQLEELDKFIKNVPGERPITFARYTGQEDTEERRRISENPPDILLTNFMMLELLMTRQDELNRRVIGNCAGLRFLVLDELHTYRGRQGADVALLVRRVRERLSPEKLQCIGTSAMSAFIVEQLPILAATTTDEPLAWSRDTLLRDWVLPRVLELTYTAWDLEPFARDVGYDGPPFRWDPTRRFLLRSELDAAFFQLYDLSRDDTDYVMDTFPIVRKNDEKAHGEYRTKRLILEIYDTMAEAARTGTPYQSRLDPPPADPRVAHPETRPAAAKTGAR